MRNQYAAFINDQGLAAYNPICYENRNQLQVGDSWGDKEVLFVGSLEEVEAFVQEQNKDKPEQSLFDTL